MKDNKLYHEIKKRISTEDLFYITLKCENKEELMLNSKLLFDVIQKVKIESQMYPFNYLMCLDTYWTKNNFDCKWKIFRIQYIDNPRLAPYINTKLNKL